MIRKPAFIARAIERRRRIRTFAREFTEFAALAEAAGPRFALAWDDRHPCLNDRTAVTAFDRHYVFHTAWAARVLARTRPARHVDVGSSLYFVTGLSAFVPTSFYDIRPAPLGLTNLDSLPGDLMRLPFADRSVESLSCMHVIEHVGLARYGDPMDPDGDLKAMRELERVVAPGGSLLFVVPVGRPRIQFNAHRIYAYEQVLDAFSALSLAEFALIPDDERQGGLMVGADPALVCDQRYACGCFWLRRPG
jgi:SAM-dependent methyltransferase